MHIYVFNFKFKQNNWCGLKLNSIDDFVQVSFVTKRKNELEKRVEELLNERENLNTTLDDTSDKVILLERHAREQDCQVHMLPFVADWVKQ